MDLGKSLGQVLRQHRKQAGLTQEDVAHRAGFDRSYVGMLENAGCSPTLVSLSCICEVIGVRLSDVIREAEEGLDGCWSPPGQK